MDTAAEVPLEDIVVGQSAGVEFFRTVRRELFSRGGETEALTALMPAVESNPLKSATLKYLVGDRANALELLAGTDTLEAVHLHGSILLEEGRSAVARDLLTKACAKFGGPDLGKLLVEAQALSGDLEKAEKLLGELDLADDDAHGDYLNGVLAERNGEYADALAFYEKAVEARPEEAVYQFRLGYLASLHGDEDRAILAYEMCQRTTPIFARAMINLGILYEDAERYDEATTCYRMVLSAYPEHPRAKMYLIDAEASTDMYYDREKEKERSRRNQLLQIPITDFELSVRSRNCLQKMNIHTLGDLIKKTEAELLSYKNFGETSLNEIKRILGQKGFHLGQGRDDDRKRHKSLPDSEHEKLLSEPVSVLELSSRSQRCMDRLGIESLAELVKRTELELVSQKNFGVTSLNEVKRKLKERNLSLASG